MAAEALTEASVTEAPIGALKSESRGSVVVTSALPPSVAAPVNAGLTSGALGAMSASAAVFV